MKLIYILLLPTLILGCNNRVSEEQESTAGLISGTVNQEDEYQNITLTFYELVSDEYSNNYFIQANSNGRFEYPLEIKFAQPFNINTKKPFGFFIFPGDTIDITISDTVHVTCTNQIHEAFINYYNLLAKQRQKLLIETSPSQWFPILTPQEFKARLYSFKHHLIKMNNDFIKTNHIESEVFKEMAANEVDFLIAQSLMDYQLINRISFKTEVKLPENYYDLVDSIVNKKQDNLITFYYISFLNRVQSLYKYANIDTLLKKINYEPLTQTQDILLARSLCFILNRDSIQNAARYFDKYAERIKRPAIRKMVLEKYENKMSLIKDPSIANALLTDLSSQVKSKSALENIIKEHKNKVMYIKLWAPWCAPCMEEIPYTKMLTEKFDASEFVVINLCVKSTKQSWRTTIAEKKITGYHYLVNDNQYNELSGLFNINGIPHHIIINKYGKVSDKNAPGPGSNFSGGLDLNLVKEISKLINE